MKMVEKLRQSKNKRRKVDGKEVSFPTSREQIGAYTCLTG